MRLLDEGMYRRVFKVKNCDLVIKFPTVVKCLDSNTVSKASGIEHSTAEIKRLRRLLKAGIPRRFLPEVFYFDKKSGVIVMRHYTEFDDFESQADAMGEMIGRLIQKLTRVRCDDIHTENVRQQGEHAVIIDLGM